MPTPDASFIEINTATFTGAVVQTIGQIDTYSTPYVRTWPHATTAVAGPRYPFNHVAGICTAQEIDEIYADFPHQTTPFAFECAPVCHHAQDLIAFRQLGLAPLSHSVVLVCDMTVLLPLRVRSNLVWMERERLDDTPEELPTDVDRIVRRAYRMQQDAHIVSLLQSDGIIASAGIRIADGYAFCFGAWVAPHRRRRGHYATLLDARLQFAADQGCHTVVLQTQTRSSVAATAEERGFTVGWTRERWMPVHERTRRASE